VPGLAKVVYHNKLGTQGERAERVRRSPTPSSAAAPGRRPHGWPDELDVLDSAEAARWPRPTC
jgi:glycyl-tRNA synthetase beta chain